MVIYESARGDERWSGMSHRHSDAASGARVRTAGKAGGKGRNSPVKNGDQESVPARVDRDRQLLEALRLREPTAADRLVTTYGDRAYRLAILVTGNAQEAEEVVQDAFRAVIRKVDTFRGELAFGSWLYRIVANAAYEKLRARRGRRTDRSLNDVLPVVDEHGRPGETCADWSPCLDDPRLQTQLRAVLTGAINDLPAKDRAVLVLRDVEGLSTLEVGQALSIRVPNVKSRVHRARLSLRKRLAKYICALNSSRLTYEKLSRAAMHSIGPTAHHNGRSSR
jgi:RNA polymerase sigma-70 factor, ECF subfamily